jgi:hypothetical protein
MNQSSTSSQDEGNEEEEFIFVDQKGHTAKDHISTTETVYHEVIFNIQSKQKICSMPHFWDDITYTGFSLR